MALFMYIKFQFKNFILISNFIFIINFFKVENRNQKSKPKVQTTKAQRTGNDRLTIMCKKMRGKTLFTLFNNLSYLA